MIVHRLTLAPDLPRRARALVDEREATAVVDAAVVVDRESQRVAERRGPGEVHDERIAVPVAAERPARRRRDRSQPEARAHVEDH